MSLSVDELLTTAKNVTVPLSKLKFAKYNPRKALKPGDKEYEYIKTSITTYGFVGDIIINADNTIINGHQRAKVCKDLGLKEVPCKMLDLDKNMERAANLAFNKVQGEWNFEAVAESISFLAENGVDMKVTGFGDSEVDALLNMLIDNGGEDADEPKEKEKGPKNTKLKSIYLSIGKDRIPISGEERDSLVNLVEEYVDKHDSPIGFVSWLVAKIEK